MKLLHLDYEIDKKKYRDIFYDNIQRGQWHWSVAKRQELFWYQLFIPDGHDMIPIIHIDHEPYPYECAFIDVGHKMHGVEKDTNARLILKFCLRHPWQEVYDRLDKFGLIKE